MRFGVFVAALGLGVAFASPQPGAAQGAVPTGPLNTLKDIGSALNGCWEWPPLDEVRGGMELTIIVSFKRSGEIFGARLSYQSKNVSPEERSKYYLALMEMLKRCSPLPVSPSLGEAIAGRPFSYHLVDNRKERKA